MNTTDEPDAARLRIALLDLEPAPWREIEVPLSMTLKGLHDAIQAAFLWHDAHLWEFEVDGRRYGPMSDVGFGDETVHKATGARLTLLPRKGTAEFSYVYDMGDDWTHHIQVLDFFIAEPGTRLPRFLRGQWRSPPEDVGGAPGFEMFLEALADPDHPEHEELLDWHGGPFDPDDIDEETVTALMGRLAKARRPKKK